MSGTTAGFPIPRWGEDVLEEQFTVAVIRKALTAALSVMLLGHIKQANRILEALYKHDAFQYDMPATREFMHYAWNASGDWPPHILRPDPDKLPAAHKNMIESQGGPDGTELVPHLQAQSRKAWADLLGKDAADVEWTDADFRNARQLAASHRGAGNRAQAASIEIALELGMDEIAAELVRTGSLPWVTHKDHRPWTNIQRHEDLYSPRLWKLLCDGWLRRELNTANAAQTEQWVDGLLELLEKRLTEGPRRALRDHSISELVHLFDETCLKNKKLGGLGAGASYYPEDIDSDDEESQMPSTFLSPPATEEQISGLEAQAKVHGYTKGLPEDYKAFLRITNGIYAPGHKDFPDNMFRPTDVIEFDDGADWAVELLPVEAIGCSLDVEFDWPCMDGSVLDLGAGGDEGVQWMLTDELTREAVEVFKTAYGKAELHDRKRIERAVKDVYGSVDRLLGLEYVVCRMYHWAAELECFAGFRHLLEATTLEAMRSDDRGNDDDDGDDQDDDDDRDDKDKDNVGDEVSAGEDDNDEEEPADESDQIEENEMEGDEAESGADESAAATASVSKKRARRESRASQLGTSSRQSQPKRTRNQV